MNISAPIVVILTVFALLGIGLYCLLITRNLIRLVVGLQIVVKGAILALVLAGRLIGQPDIGQSMALTVIVADTIIAVIGLALAVQIKRRLNTLDLKDISTLKG